MADSEVAVYVRPLLWTTWKAWILMALGLAGAVWYFYGAFHYQFFAGHQITGQGTHGAMWGTMVANIVQLIGVSHVGIAISATVRILRLERYRQLARVAELVTLVSLTAAVTNIAGDVGRPDRFIYNTMMNGSFTSPFVWSCTVITNYLVGSLVYLYLAMRRDIYLCSRVLPRRRYLYRILALGYSDTPEERANHERTVFWCAVIILPIMVSVHSVYGFVFGLHPGRPGWFNPFQPPYFVLGAIVTGFSGVVMVAALITKVYRWEHFFPARMFKGLGIFLGFVTLLYLYFLFCEILTGVYSSPEAERGLFADLLFGRFAPIVWGATVGGMILPFWILFVQGGHPRIVSTPVVVVAAAPIFVAMWCWRYLITVPSFFHPHLPYRLFEYSPTLFDWSLVLGTYGFCLVAYIALIKLLPILEIPKEFVPERPVRPRPLTARRRRLLGLLKRATITLTTISGITLIAYGIATRHDVRTSSPAIWISGIVLLWTIPIQACFIPGYRLRTHHRVEPDIPLARPVRARPGKRESTKEVVHAHRFGVRVIRGIR